MRILYLTWDDLEKPTCGCAQRSAFLYEALKRIGEVNVIRLRREWIREGVVAKIFRQLTKVARWPFGRPSIDPACVIEKYDAIVCRYLMTAALTQAWKIAPCYVDIDDMPRRSFPRARCERMCAKTLWNAMCGKNDRSDSGHLNVEGARRFAERIKQDRDQGEW